MSKQQHIQKPDLPQGFTMIELLFSTAILGFMLSMTIITFIGVFRFYVWAGTIRTNQSSARELMDTITREIASKKILSTSGSSICLVDPSQDIPSTSVQILREGTTVKRNLYSSSGACSGGAISESISNPSLRVTELVFVKIDGAVNNPYVTGPNSSLLHRSATIKMTIVNGTPDKGTKKCKPADNFCDVANYSTAVTERNSGS